jgi:hypothetical protein
LLQKKGQERRRRPGKQAQSASGKGYVQHEGVDFNEVFAPVAFLDFFDTCFPRFGAVTHHNSCQAQLEVASSRREIIFS